MHPFLNISKLILKYMDNNCPLCQEIDKQNLVIRNFDNFAITLNKYPYKPGHIMVLPKEHKPNLTGLSPEHQCELIQIISWATRLFEKDLDTPSLNIGINHGYDSGASIPQHLHVHIVPRKHNDIGFVDIIAREPTLREDSIKYAEKVKEVFMTAAYIK